MWRPNNIMVLFLVVAIATGMALPAIAKGADDSSGSSAQSTDPSSSGSSSTPDDTPDDMSTPDDSPDDMSTPDDRGGEIPRDDRQEIGDDRGEGPDDKGGLVPRDNRQEIGDDRREGEQQGGVQDDNVEQEDVKQVDAMGEDKGILDGIGKFFSGIFGFMFRKEAEKETEKIEVEQEITGKVADDGVAADDKVDDNQGNKNKGPIEAIGDFFTGLFGPKLDSSGKGYPTGVLIMSVPATQLTLDRVGQVKGGEVKDRQYEGVGQLPVTIGGTLFYATEIKVISNLKAKNGIGQHSGTIDVDIDNIADPTRAGHVALQYQGSATVSTSLSGTTIVSGGTFKTSKTTGIFAGLVASGTYTMAILESGTTLGSPATVSITTE